MKNLLKTSGVFRSLWINLHSKSMKLFLYDRDLRHKRANSVLNTLPKAIKCKDKGLTYFLFFE